MQKEGTGSRSVDGRCAGSYLLIIRSWMGQLPENSEKVRNSIDIWTFSVGGHLLTGKNLKCGYQVSIHRHEKDIPRVGISTFPKGRPLGGSDPHSPSADHQRHSDEEGFRQRSAPCR